MDEVGIENNREGKLGLKKTGEVPEMDLSISADVQDRPLVLIIYELQLDPRGDYSH